MRYATLALMAVLCAGCFGRSTYTPTAYYTVDPAPAVQPAGECGLRLGVRPLEPARPYSRSKIAYRADGHVLGHYPGVEWAELPGDLVTRALMDALAASGRFSDVGRAIDMAAPDLILTGQLRRFDEARTEDPPVAVCEVRLELRHAVDRQALWADTLTASVPLERDDVAGLSEAMSRAVGDLVAEAAARITQIEFPAEAPAQ